MSLLTELKETREVIFYKTGTNDIIKETFHIQISYIPMIHVDSHFTVLLINQDKSVKYGNTFSSCQYSEDFPTLPSTITNKDICGMVINAFKNLQNYKMYIEKEPTTENLTIHINVQVEFIELNFTKLLFKY